MKPLDISDEVESALSGNRPVVALESTLIAHGLPWPTSVETALAAEEVIRAEGATPATIAVLGGRPTVGLTRPQIESLATTPGVLKASTRDLAYAVTQKRTAATTVAATMSLAEWAGIRVFATGGIGGVHLHADRTGDISADLTELARTRVAVVCAGAKNILDLRRTLEMLETLSVPVVGYQTDDFPAFYLRSSGEPVSARVDSPREAAGLLSAHWRLEGGGVVLGQPVAEDVALAPDEWDHAYRRAEELAAAANVRGKDVTPFLLARLAELTGGRSLRANQALIVANARLAALVAAAL
jgi:pseudouridine-5'-phosphate glycosidase